MKFHALSLGLALNAVVSFAVRVPFQRAKRSVLQRRSGGASVSVSSPSSGLANSNVLSSGGGNSNAFGTRCVTDMSIVRGSLLN